MYKFAAETTTAQRIEDVCSLFNSGRKDEALNKLLSTLQACPKHETKQRDQISELLLAFAQNFINEKKYEQAFAALKAAREGSLLFFQRAQDTITYLERLLDTHRLIEVQLDKQKMAKALSDLDGIAETRSEILKLKTLNKNRFNPLSIQHSQQLNYPSFIHMETLAVCNAACTFCPYPELERKGTRMPDELIEKIIDDLTDIPPNVRFQIAPYKVSDPFIEKRLISIIELIEDKLPNAYVTLISNGSTMTEKVLRRLAKLKNVEHLKISLNEHRKEEYEKLMSLPFEKTLDRIDMLSRLIQDGSFPIPVVVNKVMEGNRSDIEFQRFCADRFPGIQATLTCRNDWIGNVDEKTAYTNVPDVACSRWFNVSIIATGEVSLCCMDGHGQYSLGNVQNDSILDIYNSERFRVLREHTLSRHDAPSPCNSCTYI